MKPSKQQQLAERLADKLLFITGVNKPGTLVFPALSEFELAGAYNRSELVDLFLTEIRKTPA